MTENPSSEKGNEESERELLKTNQEILFRIRGFSRQTIEVSLITLALIVLYLSISLILFIFFKIKMKIGIIELGNATPLFILISTLINEGRVRIMEWAAVRRERREYEKEQREEKLRAEGRAEGRVEGRAEGRQELLNELKAKGVDTSKIDSKPQE